VLLSRLRSWPGLDVERAEQLAAYYLKNVSYSPTSTKMRGWLLTRREGPMPGRRFEDEKQHDEKDCR